MPKKVILLITKLRKSELQSCAARKLQSYAEKLQSCAGITKLRKKYYKVAQLLQSCAKLQSCAEHQGTWEKRKIVPFNKIIYEFRIKEHIKYTINSSSVLPLTIGRAFFFQTFTNARY